MTAPQLVPDVVSVEHASCAVPARLSDGEFVFTAEAVRGVGEGSRHAGAQRLYAAMKDMERRARR